MSCPMFFVVCIVPATSEIYTYYITLSLHDALPICLSAFARSKKMDKRTARLRRAKSTRAHIRELGVPRLSVLRTGQHVYAQLFSADGSQVLASASTTQTDVRDGLKSNKNIEARSEEHTSELQSLMRISYDVFLMN